jgi:hypothetical protein
MSRSTILIVSAALAALTVSADEHSARPCASPEARDFDFWVGDWRIEQQILSPDGTWMPFAATSSVAPALGGCALVEHWEGRVQFFWEEMREPVQMKGLSVRAYDPQTKKWYIHWMDTRTPHFGGPYAGNFNAGQGRFFREWESPQGLRTGRITFSDITADSVKWELAVSNDEGQSWTPLWVMRMYRTQD